MSQNFRPTPRYNHKPYPMHRMEGQDAKFSKIGDFYWQIGEGGKRSLMVAIPCISQSGFIVTEWTIDYPNEGGHSWSWDGNLYMPTLTPSLHAVGIWHGHVRQGYLCES